MGNIGIIGAMDIEVQLIKDKITISDKKQYGGFKFYLAKYKDFNVVITCCGVGKVNASSCTQILIDKFNVTKIINTGVAGSLNEKVKLCDIVISDNVTYHDVNKFQMKECFPYKEFFNAEKQLIKLAIKAYESIVSQNYNYHVGRIVTGEIFVEDDVLKEKIIHDYNPYCVEMEGGAIGHVAYINEVPFVVIRSISDNADKNATAKFDEFKNFSADNSATLVLKMLDLMS